MTVVHRTSTNGYETVCGYIVNNIRQERKHVIMRKPHTKSKIEETLERYDGYRCLECFRVFPEEICEW